MKKIYILFTILLGIYLLTHFYNLTGIPVFADEAIYIRWAQLIISDAKQYLFFPLNDGKTPLYIWLLVPFLKTATDPLFISRAVSVFIGALQIGVLTYAYRLLHKDTRFFLPALIVLTTPFWVMYHRFALMDALLTLFSTLLLICTIRFSETNYTNINIVKILQKYFGDKKILKISILFGLCFFLALFTKLPSLLLIPSFGIFLLLSTANWRTYPLKIVQLGSGLALAAFLFFILSFHPSFPQLFSRGSDFLYKLSDFKEVYWGGVIFGNTLFVIMTHLQYLSLPLFLVLLITPFFQKSRLHLQLLLASLVFFLPFIFLAKVLHGRYLLPALPYITLSLATSISFIHQKIKKKYSNPIALVILYTVLFIPTIWSTTLLITDPEIAPITSDDRSQYFQDWSSGHGIRETYELIKQESKTKSIAVATEGTFGTLPDGILMYLFNNDVENIYIEGIGQPVFEVSGKYLKRAKEYDEHWLVVNNFRMHLRLPEDALLHEFCRPQMPEYCLQIWDISTVVE